MTSLEIKAATFFVFHILQKCKCKSVYLGNQNSIPSIFTSNCENVQVQKCLSRKSNSRKSKQQPLNSNQTTITKIYKCKTDELGKQTNNALINKPTNKQTNKLTTKTSKCKNDECGNHTRGRIGVLFFAENTNILNRVFS